MTVGAILVTCGTFIGRADVMGEVTTLGSGACLAALRVAVCKLFKRGAAEDRFRSAEPVIKSSVKGKRFLGGSWP
jgi:hypothetical protein